MLPLSTLAQHVEMIAVLLCHTGTVFQTACPVSVPMLLLQRRSDG